MIRKGNVLLVVCIILLTFITQLDAQDTVPDAPSEPAVASTPATPSSSPSPSSPSTPPSSSTSPQSSQPSFSTLPSTTSTSTPPTPPGSDEDYGDCWSCLFDLLGSLCDSFGDWDDYEPFNIFSFFFNPPSVANFNKRPAARPSNQRRPSRSSLSQLRESSEVDEAAVLDLLHAFYLKSRDSFARDHPSISLSSNLKKLYKLPDELALVAADVLQVRKKDVVETFEKLTSRETGVRLWQAMDERLQMPSKNGQKTLADLTPTSISYFFKEFLASLNGVTTGVSELATIVLQNQTYQNVIPGSSS